MAKDKSSKKAEAKTEKKKGTTYNLHDFAKSIAEDKSIGAGEVHTILSEFFGSIETTVTSSSLEVGDKINLPGLGQLVCRQNKPRIARNPKTGEKIQVPARPAVKFRLASSMRLWGKPVKAAPKKSEKKSKK